MVFEYIHFLNNWAVFSLCGEPCLACENGASRSKSGLFGIVSSVTLENHCSGASLSISSTTPLNHRKHMVSYDLHFRSGILVLTWCRRTFEIICDNVFKRCSMEINMQINRYLNICGYNHNAHIRPAPEYKYAKTLMHCPWGCGFDDRCVFF